MTPIGPENAPADIYVLYPGQGSERTLDALLELFLKRRLIRRRGQGLVV